MGVCLAVHEVLGYYVIGLVGEALVGDCLNLESEIESAEVLEGNGGHSDLVLLCGDLYHGGILIGLVEVLDADYLRHLALREDWKADGL